MTLERILEFSFERGDLGLLLAFVAWWAAATPAATPTPTPYAYACAYSDTDDDAVGR